MSHPISKQSSIFLSAVAGFFVINMIVHLNHPFQYNTKAMPSRTWSWWTLKDIKALKSTPNVVLLGSSLMVSAMAECDAMVSHQRLDLTSYRGASYFQHQLSKGLPGSYSTMNLAAPGQMPSDAFLTLKALLATGNRPALVIYGVAPRDFLDGTLQNPADTEAFKYLNHFVDLQGSDLDFFHSPLGKLDWILKKSLALYDHAPDLRLVAMNVFPLSTPGPASLSQNGHGVTTNLLATAIRAQLEPLRIEPGSLVAEFLRAAASREHIAQDMANYSLRYKNPDAGIYSAQFRFLRRLAYLCRQNGISLVLVNMPITSENKKLIKPVLFRLYNNDLTAFSQANCTPLIDMDSIEPFSADDFRDTVHLNGVGGQKFVDRLVCLAANNITVREAIIAASRCAQRQSLAASNLSRM